MKEQKTNKEKGITLVALVVTIVVLIILATVSVNAVIGDNGIINKTKNVKTMFKNKVALEDDSIQKLANESAGYGIGSENTENKSEDGTTVTPDAGTVIAKPENWTSTQVTPIADGNNGIVPLPNGFYYVGGDISTGLVISDKQDDKINASGTSMGNQFVWIPVSEENIGTTTFDSSGQPISGLSTNYIEPFTSGYKTEVSEYNTMKAQVLKYGGFYIGRFEAGVNTTRLRTGYTTAEKVVCKKGVAPYVYVPWGESISSDNQVSGKSGAVYLSKKMYSSSSSVVSTLVYGCQWDAMCKYVGDSQRTTPTRSVLELTGTVTTDVSKNIYDLAGNCYEWTMEVDSSTKRVLRGGYVYYAYSINHRTGYNPAYGSGHDAFRPALYIK